MKIGFYCLVAALALSGCINLRHIDAYSASALASVNQLNEFDDGFTQHCRDRCRFNAIDSFKIYRKLNCPCKDYERADSVVRILVKATATYFIGLSQLSKNNLTHYRVDPLKKALKAEDLKVFQLNKEVVNAYSKLADVLLHAFTDSFRQRKIKEYVRSANPSLQLIISKLEFIEFQNLNDLLSFKKERLFEQSEVLLRRQGLNEYEKQHATEEYYQGLEKIENSQMQILLTSRSLKLIAAGHQKIDENLDKISATDLKQKLLSYAKEIQDLIMEFDKLKH